MLFSSNLLNKNFNELQICDLFELDFEVFEYFFIHINEYESMFVTKMVEYTFP